MPSAWQIRAEMQKRRRRGLLDDREDSKASSASADVDSGNMGMSAALDEVRRAMQEVLLDAVQEEGAILRSFDGLLTRHSEAICSQVEQFLASADYSSRPSFKNSFGGTAQVRTPPVSGGPCLRRTGHASNPFAADNDDLDIRKGCKGMEAALPVIILPCNPPTSDSLTDSDNETEAPPTRTAWNLEVTSETASDNDSDERAQQEEVNGMLRRKRIARSSHMLTEAIMAEDLEEEEEIQSQKRQLRLTRMQQAEAQRELKARKSALQRMKCQHLEGGDINRGVVQSLEEALWEKAADIVVSPRFDYASAFLIILNSIFVGIQTDEAASEPGAEPNKIWRATDAIFCLLFTGELLWRVYVFRLQFFTLPDWKWNVFDTILVVLQLFEETLAVIIAVTGASTEDDDGVAMNFSFMRVLRVLKLVRIIRLFRVLRIIGELRTIVASIAGCIRPLMSAVILLMLMMYVFGVFFTQVVTSHFEESSETLATYTSESPLVEHFGSLFQSVYSLYKAILGGEDWGDLSNPIIQHISPAYGVVFTLYIAFSSLAMMNVMTGVFVEAALAIAKKDEDRDMMNHLRQLLAVTDVEGDGRLTLAEFKAQMQSPEMMEFFKCIDIDSSEALALFDILDCEDTGTLISDNFVNGCLRLRSPARALDLEVLGMQQRKLQALILKKLQKLEDLAHHGGRIPSRQCPPSSGGLPIRETSAKQLLRAAASAASSRLSGTNLPKE
eukprot:TRINITY_DN31923_c0_g1_i1.p1 TRINITY_DN31923_c0_g1~~TRINITY_DN31923_c0_g1_i1.p1  ORF type:complete len:727 (-),score=226.81 TRINITY_DN31923_c0_g1_i1:307-2487(-)